MCLCLFFYMNFYKLFKYYTLALPIYSVKTFSLILAFSIFFSQKIIEQDSHIHDDLNVKLLFLNVKVRPNKSCLCHPAFIVNLLLSTWIEIKGLYYVLFINE